MAILYLVHCSNCYLLRVVVKVIAVIANLGLSSFVKALAIFIATANYQVASISVDSLMVAIVADWVALILLVVASSSIIVMDSIATATSSYSFTFITATVALFASAVV